MSEDPRKSLKLQKQTNDFERRLHRNERKTRKLAATQRNLNNPSSTPTIIGTVPPDPSTNHDELLGLSDDDHPQYPKKTGWDLGLDETSVTIAMTDGTRTFTITPIVESLQYYITGVRYEVRDPATVIITDTEGIWFIYYVGPTLTASQIPWDIAAGGIAMVAVVYWDATNNASITIGWEFHTYVMDLATHEENHHTLGTRFREGLGVADAGGNLIDVSAGIIYDEDIKIDITDGVGGTLFEQVLSPAEMPLLYRDGAAGDWRKIAATTSPVIIQAGNLKLNEFVGGVWQLTSVAALKYICYWILATDDIAEPVISIPGQVEGTSAQAVRDANPLASMSFGSLPVQEYKVIARLIIQEAVADPFYALSAIDDFRDVSQEPGGGTTVTDHSSLTGVTTSQHHVKTVKAVSGDIDHGGVTGLTDDDHPQYFLLPTSGAKRRKQMTFAGLLVYDSSNSMYHQAAQYIGAGATDNEISFDHQTHHVSGKTLHMDDITIDLLVADATDFVTSVFIYGVAGNATLTLINSYSTNRTAQGSYTNALTTTDISSYDRISIRIVCTLATAGQFSLLGARAQYWYV